MTVSKENIKVGLLALVAIILIINLVTIFRQKKPVDNSRELIKAYDVAIKATEHDRETMREFKDFAIVQIHKADSIRVIQYQTKVIQYEKITPTVRNYNNDELRRAIENY